MKNSAIACCTLLLFVGLAAGQEYRGTILGRVADPSGAVVPQASVTVMNTATGDRKQPQAISRVGLERPVAAVQAHETYDILEPAVATWRA